MIILLISFFSLIPNISEIANSIIMVNNRIGKNSLIKFGKNKDKNLKVKWRK